MIEVAVRGSLMMAAVGGLCGTRSPVAIGSFLPAGGTSA